MKKLVVSQLQRLLTALFLAIIVFGQLSPISIAQAAVSLTIEPITWNVIGLDSNNVNVGPNNFPVGARVCNRGDSPATNVTSSFVWDTGGTDDAGTYIYLRPGSLNNFNSNKIASLAPGSCYDFYYEIQVKRDSAAYEKTRRYYITTSADGISAINTPRPREVYIEYLISQNRNSTDNVSFGLGVNPPSLTSIPAGGSFSLQVGNTYTIKLDASTATQGYNQLENFINFPNTIFQILSVSSRYSADTSGYVGNSSDKLYADACLWDMDPNSLTYLSCIGSDGKTGGTISTTYVVKIIGGAGTNQAINTLIYDYSGSSFHYNSDFSSSARFAAITSPLSMSKAFSPVSIAADDTSTLSINISNNSASDLTGISLIDPLPSSPAQMIVAASPDASASANCIGASFSPAGGDTFLTYSGGVKANSTCTLTVTVTATSIGNYTNTTGNIYLNGIDTGTSASANLTVAEQQNGTGFCATNVTMAQWTVPSTTTNPPDTTGGVPSIKNANVTTATVVAAVSGSTAIKTTSGQNDTYSWSVYGFKTSGNYVDFTIDTSKFRNVKLNFYMDNPGGGNGPDSIDITYNNGSGFQSYTPSIIPSIGWTQYNLDFTNKTNTGGNTIIRLKPPTAGADNQNGNLLFDLITFTGDQTTDCTSASAPTLTKSFLTSPVAQNATTTLRFTMTNPNATQLTGVAFTDTLPIGLTIPSGSATVCGGTLSTTSPNLISFSGGTIPASGNCNISVTVTGVTPGTYTNTSGFISTYESGTNNTSTGFGTANLTVLSPPQITKSFSPQEILSGNSSTVSFTISNLNNTAINGLSFTDNLPTSPGTMTVISPGVTNDVCGAGSTLTTSNSPSRIILAGGSLAANESCTFSTTVTAPTGSYTNSVAVTSTNAGTSTTANASLTVREITPEISIHKEISTSPSGPWAKTVFVKAGDPVYYRLTIENTGDVPLSPVWVTDPNVSTSSCLWPAILPVASAISDPTANCVVGPVTALSGTHPNTATAHGTYNGAVYNSDQNSASYATTALILDKTVSEGSFTAAGDALHYSYKLTNTGDVSLADPVTVIDTKTPVTCTESLSTAGPGHDGNGTLDKDEYITCTATYHVTPQDVSIGSVSNSAYATIGGVRSNLDRVTVFSNQPDLIVTKTNLTNGQATDGVPFTWTLKVSNQGPVAGIFTASSEIVRDPLPTGATYGVPTVGASSGVTNLDKISCAIDGSRVLTCVANGDDVTIGASTGFVSIEIPVTPNALGNLINTATVDGDSNVTEGDEGNNNGIDVVVVNAPLPDMVVAKTNNTSSNGSVGTSFTWTLTVQNQGGAEAVFAQNAVILQDVFPEATKPADGVVSVTSGSTPPSGTIACSVSSGILACVASGGSVTFTPGASFSIAPAVIPTSSGNLTNTAVVDPNHILAESNSGNNTGSDTVSVIGVPDLGLAKSNSVTSISAGGVTTYTLTVSNSGSVATSGTITIVDVLPTGMSVNPGEQTLGGDQAANWTCNASSSTVITCTSDVEIAATSGTSIFSLPVNISSSASGTLINKAQVGGGGDPNTGTPDSTTASTCTATNTPSKGCAVDSDAIYQPPIVTKAFGAASISSGGTTTLTLTLSNPSDNPGDLTTLQVDDTFPSGMTLKDTTFVFTPSACGSITKLDNSASAASDGAVRFKAAAISAGSSCEVVLNISSSTPGEVTNTTGTPIASGPVNLTGNTTSDSLTVNELTNTGTINGVVYHDVNKNQTRDGGESGISGVTVTLKDSNDQVVATTTTDSNGGYSFSGLNPGSYTIVETDPNNYDSTTENSVSVVLGSEETKTINFGDFAVPTAVNDTPADIAEDSGLVNINVLGNDSFGGDGPSTGTITITVGPGATGTAEVNDGGTPSDPSDDSIDFTPTANYNGPVTFTYEICDANGDCDTAVVSFNVTSLNDLPDAVDDNPADIAENSGLVNIDVLTNDSFGGDGPSTGTITVTVGAGSAGTAAVNNGGTPNDPTDDTIDFTPATDYNGPVSFTYQICDANGDCDTAVVSFNILPNPGTVSGVVYQDTNANGVRDSGEAPISGVTIELYDNDGTLIATQITNGLGIYNFSSVPVGDYSVVEVDPLGFTSTTSNMIDVTVTSGSSATADFGERKLVTTTLSTISGTVFFDANSNAIQDIGETGLAWQTITLLNANGQVVATTTTDANGGYSFSGLSAGVYTVVETDPDGYDSTTLNSVSVVIGSGEENSVDFGDIVNQNPEFADPAVTKYGDPTLAKVGDIVVFTITVGNNGTINAENVVLTDTKPSFLNIVAINIQPAGEFPINISGNTISIQFGTVRPEDVYTVIVTTRVNALGLPPGGSNEVVVTSDTSDPVLSNNNGSSQIVISSVELPEEIPNTGFAPGSVVNLPNQPTEKLYAKMDELTLEIPVLKVKMPVVGVPISNGAWDITWLNREAGWLNGTAFPTWQGNSALVGHVYLPNGLPGPFLNLNKLGWGDQVIVKANGTRFTYEVRSVQYIKPDHTSVLDHKETPWLTLITCRGYDEKSGSYALRVAVQAVLVNVENEK